MSRCTHYYICYYCFFFLAGDFVKFGFTMASTTTILAWGYLNYKDVYEKASEYRVFVQKKTALAFRYKRYERCLTT